MGAIPIVTDAAPGITSIDTGMAGQRELNAVYLLRGSQPCLVETGPGSDGPAVVRALTDLGVGADDLAHLVVTHIHMDHAGGAGSLLERYPRATVWVHERGAAHLVDPARLVASTARTYGEERMRALYGEMVPSPSERVRAVADGDLIDLGDRALEVLSTPGHASHHVALLDTATGAMCTGEAIGSYLPWADAYRPALPPPEVDVEAALASVDRIRSRHPSSLLTSHFGPTPDVEAACTRAAARIVAWSDEVARALRADPDVGDDDLTAILRLRAEREFAEDSAEAPFDLARYDALGSIRMNAQGLGRYWRKRWQRERSAG